MPTKLVFPADFDSPEDFLSAIIGSSDDAIITKDLNGVVTSWNQSAERIFGYTAAEMIGKPILVLVPPERHEEEPMILDRLRRGERVEHFETTRVAKDGKLVYLSLTISPVKNRAGTIVGASKIARDIADQKTAAASIAAAAAEIQRQSRMKDEFLAMLSHELRTPLQSIAGWVQILKMGKPTPEEFSQAMTVIERNTEAQQRIIDDLLDINRILSGKVRIDVQPIDLKDLLTSSVETIKPSADVKGIQIELEIVSFSVPMRGDQQRLQQVFWNLLGNAVKFTPRGGKIRVNLQRNQSEWAITISDSGKGIAGDFLPFVFDRFRQADASSTRSHGGLGLGLALVKQLVEMHGGRVSASSPGPDLGSTFEIVFPVAALTANSADPSWDADRANSAPFDSAKLAHISVLVVDDDTDSRELIGITLAKAGAVVRTASNVQDGLARIREALPDVLVSDIGMPETNGYSFLETLRGLPAAEGGKVPAIALTAFTRPEDRVLALCAGFQMLLQKPTNASELIESVRSLASARSKG